MLHCLKIKQMKESEHSGPYKDLGFLPDIRVTMLHYSHSCLHEMEENLVPFIFKGIEEEKAKLPAISACSRSQPQHNYSFQGPSSPRSLAMRLLHQFSTFKAAKGLSHPIQGALIQFPMESIAYLQRQSSYPRTDHHRCAAALSAPFA